MDSQIVTGKKKNTVLITGASAGIGYELSVLFAQNKYDLVLVARNKDRLEKIAGEIELNYNVSATCIAKDLSDKNAPQEIYEELRNRNISINILVNNAGFNEYGRFSETDIQKEIDLIHVNLMSLTILTKLLLPNMLKNQDGKILNIGSTGSYAPGPYNAVYCATKAYVLSFSTAIAEELKGTGVSVTTLCPGATRTEFAGRAGMDDVRNFNMSGLVQKAEDVAKIGYRALMRKKVSVVSGNLNKIQIFMIRFTPRSFLVKVSGYLMGRKPVQKTKGKMVSVLKFFAFFSLISLLLAGHGTYAVENWRLKTNKNGINVYSRVYSRVEERVDINEVRATSIINADIAEVSARIEDISSYPQWMAGCIEANLYKQIDEKKRIVYSVNKLQWPLNNREAYYLQDWQYDNAEKTVTMSFKAIRMDDTAVPEGNIRMTDVTGKWTLKKTGPGQTAVDFRIKCDPAGNLPDSFVNMASASMPYDTLANLEKACQKKP